MMKVIEDNWGSFPRVETCIKCKSKVELESRKDCTYQSYLCSFMNKAYSDSNLFERKEAFIWECPCCKTKNYIYI